MLKEMDPMTDFDLHGAMECCGTQDAEGDLIKRVREVISRCFIRLQWIC
jgi:microcystin degradation protein MlrC